MTKSKKLVTAGACLALCLVLPFITGQIQAIGNMLLPMHLPVLFCGFVTGPAYAMAVGFIAPLLRYLLFGMPTILPIGLAMSFELAASGAICGLLCQKLPRKTIHLYISLVGAMLGGRIVWGIVAFFLNRMLGNPFTLSMFFASAFTNAIPGIVIQLVLIPPEVLALRKSRLMAEL